MTRTRKLLALILSSGIPGILAIGSGLAHAQVVPRNAAPLTKAALQQQIVAPEDFSVVMSRMQAAKPAILKRHHDLLEARYELGDHSAAGVTMAHNQRDLTRFDLDFDLPDHLLPEFPPPMFLTTRPDLGDVSQGKLVTMDYHFELLSGFLNPKQLEGVRLLVSPFMQQQFHQTDDRRSIRPSRGVTCFDCHANGHTNAATHLAGDVRPQEFRHRIDTPTLRGVNIQQIFGSQRAMKSVEDFTEFEQRGAYFDGDPVLATKKGVNILERGSQVHFMAEFQELLDFPPAPKLNVFGKLDSNLASEPELRGQILFFGKAQMRHLPFRSLLHRQPVIQLAGRTLLQATNDHRPHGVSGRSDQDISPAWHQGLAAVLPRWPITDT